MDPTGGHRVPRALRDGWATLAVGALVVTACLPLARVFVGLEFLWTVLAAAVLALAVDWGCRRVGLGPTLTLVASIAAWGLFVSYAFLGESLWFGTVPTLQTLGAGKDLWMRGLELIGQRPTPAYAEAGLLLVAVNGVWAVAHAVDGLIFRLQSALAGIVMATVLWCVPLALAPETAAAWAWAAPFLAAAAAVLLVSAGREAESFGAWHDPRGTPRTPLLGLGASLAVLAIVAGVVVAGVLPGFAEGPLLDLRGGGGSTLTGNPIVDIRSNLVASGTSTVLTVDTPRPVYIRTTALDEYSSEREEWTNAGIEGQPVRDGFVRSDPAVTSELIDARITLGEIDGAVLVPAPYQVVRLSGTAADLAYDPRLATATTRGGEELQSGETYDVVAQVPNPTAEELASVSGPPQDPELAALPDVIPPEVPALARQIVDRAEATTWFDQALAIQDELRTWTYSIEGAEEGHSGTAMQAFLASRTGYCEQYAGTMAVMLRSLGIPARVAVGFTPGQPVGPSVSDGVPRSGNVAAPGERQSYAISWSNAHAWVEVDFAQYGWVTFEPTPRGDGNVLVPTAANLAPRETVGQAVPQPGDDIPAAIDDINQGDTGFDVPAVGSEFPAVDDAVGPGGPGGARGVRTGLVGLLVLGLAGVGVVAGVGLRSSRARTEDPRDRVLAARARIGRLGAGLSAPVTPWETDAEYLDRIVGVAARRSGGERTAEAEARTLAQLSAQARWARAMAPDDAARADEAASAVQAAMLRRMGAVERTVVRARGPVVAGTEVLRRAVSRRRDRAEA